MKLLGERKVMKALERIAEFDVRRLEAMLDTDMPPRWAFDTAVADLAPRLNHPELESALTGYVVARLRQDLRGLIEAGLVGGETAEALSKVRRPDSYHAWAAVRAADLVTEGNRLKRLAEATANDEFGRTCGFLARRCVHVAAHDLAHPPTDACAQAAVTLALAHSITRQTEGLALYEGDVLARHRKLVAEAGGREVDAPVIPADFRCVGAIRGDLHYPKSKYGHAPRGRRRQVWLNRDKVEAELEHNNGYSETITHEFVHTLQDDEPVSKGDEERMGETTLLSLLREGATEAEARMLLAAHVGDNLHEDVCREDMAFVYGIAATAANDAKAQGSLVSEMAFAPRRELPNMALRFLCGSEVPSRRPMLVRAASAYAHFAYDGPKRDREELRRESHRLCQAVRSGDITSIEGARHA
jgi:hypothetical protein